MAGQSDEIGVGDFAAGSIAGTLGAIDGAAKFGPGDLAGNVGRLNVGVTIALGTTDVIDAALNGKPGSVAVQSGGLVGGVVGGLAGAEVGAAAGAAGGGALGSVIPGAGTAAGAAVGGFLGSVFGAIVGSIYGERAVESVLGVTEVDNLRDKVLSHAETVKDVASQIEMLMDSPSHTSNKNDLLGFMKDLNAAYGISAGHDRSGGHTGMGNDPLDPRGYDQRPGAPGDRTSSGSVQPGKTGPQYGSDTRAGGTGYKGDHPGPGAKSSSVSKSNSGVSTTGGGAADSGQAANGKSKDVSKNSSKDKSKDNDPGKTGPQPILLDLDGDGIELTDLSRSTMQVDSAGDGLLHRTAWAGAGDGVLFIDADGNGQISNSHEYVFTKWAGGAADDLDALRKVFDSNGDGKLTSADARWGEFRVLVSQADGSKVSRTLAELGITEINLTADATKLVSADGSAITGQAKFKINGVDRTVANTRLMAEAEGHRVVEAVTVNGAGQRTVVQTGYDKVGDKVFVTTSVTSANGLSISNSYDLNGDGVVDRLQTIQTVMNGNGSRTETVINKQGSNPATAVLLNRTVTTTSADGKQMTIQRDSTGGGWFDQSEVRATAVDGSRTLVISDLARDGSVIRSSSETISVSGMVRSRAENLDGQGGADRVVTETITTSSGARTEVTAITNGDGSARSSETVTVSADGKTRVVSTDVNADALADRVATVVTSLAGNGSNTTVETVRNRDNSLRAQQTTTVSADGLTTQVSSDTDGNGSIDRVVQDVTVVAAGQRTQTVTQTNSDGSVFDLRRTVLGADKTTYQEWVDLNQNGVFEATDLIKDVTVDAATGTKTAITYARNPDGTISAKETATTNSAGTSTTQVTDADGDGDTDKTVVDTTVVDSYYYTSAQTITTTNGDGSQQAKRTIHASSDGLIKFELGDTGGSTADDYRLEDDTVLSPDGSYYNWVRRYAGDGTTKLSSQNTTLSADRLTQTVTTDANGDGVTDSIVASVESQNGTKTITTTQFHENGAVKATNYRSVAPNGLNENEATDLNGDGVLDQYKNSTTMYYSYGEKVHVSEIVNADGSLKLRDRQSVSGNGLNTWKGSDNDGDGLYESVSVSSTTILANGSTQTDSQNKSQNGAVFSSARKSVSANGLVTVDAADVNADGIFDLSTTSTTTIGPNGSRSTIVETRDSSNALRSRLKTTATDDQRNITTTQDVNGDGVIDINRQSVIADSGVRTETVIDRNQSGVAVAQKTSTVSANGLVSTTLSDSNGDGSNERSVTATKVLNANGSVTQTEIVRSANSSILHQVQNTASDDGWVKSTSIDVDGDGTFEQVTGATYSLASNGIETTTVDKKSENLTLISSETTVVTANKKSETKTINLDGLGGNEVTSQTTLATDGRVLNSTSFASTSGTVIATTSSTVSGSGLQKRQITDRNADGRAEVIRDETRTLHANGDVTTLETARNDRFQGLGSREIWVDASGDNMRVLFDRDGDGKADYRTEIVKDIEVDGDRVTLAQAYDAQSKLLSTSSVRETGNGLFKREESDLNGDGGLDRTYQRVTQASGAWTEEVQNLGANGITKASNVTTGSADGRIVETLFDLDGNGSNDRRVRAEVDFSRNSLTLSEDLRADGSIIRKVTGVSAFNGHSSSTTIDIDGDGDLDIQRETVKSHQADGAVVTEFTEKFSPDGTLAAAKLAYKERTTTSGNGMSAQTTIDVDGNGTTDATKTVTRIINLDGTEELRTQTVLADGSLRYSDVINSAANGRSQTRQTDFDGNGFLDEVVASKVLSDGSRSTVETGYNAAGRKNLTLETTVSADGLITTIQRANTVETIQRSAINSEVYTWTSGANTVRHELDGAGVETWSYSVPTQVQTGGGPDGPVYTTVIVTHQAKLLAPTKAEILTQATRIYDAVLDRNMELPEQEMLVYWIKEGQLDKAGLASSLISSGEATTRYGTQSDADFVRQIYLNSYFRAPTMQELDEHIRDIVNGSMTRVQLAVHVAESSEHIATGNGHQATNNFNIALNPAQFERSVDRPWVEAQIKNIFDVIFDRDPTNEELKIYTDQVLTGTKNLESAVEELRVFWGQVAGVNASQLEGLSGTALVEQAFRHAFGREASNEEVSRWSDHLSAGRISTAEFILALASSTDKLAIGNGHLTYAAPSIAMVNGTANSDNLFGGSGRDSILGGAGHDNIQAGSSVDYLIGGTGNDTLDGQGSGDVYLWQRGDGNDLISDSGTGQFYADRLVLSDVSSTQAVIAKTTYTYYQQTGPDSGHWVNENDAVKITITTGSSTEIIILRNFMSSLSDGRSVEQIHFSDGVIWTKTDIVNRALATAGTGNDNITGTILNETILGLAGNDTLTGQDGNDVLTGGLGNDMLYGGNGDDRYLWSLGDSNDTIVDDGNSLVERDILDLSAVNQASVTLSRLAGSADLRVTILDGSTTSVLVVQNQFLNGATIGLAQNTGRGVEAIRLSGNTIWTLDDIYARTVFAGSTGNDNLAGTVHADRIEGGAGQDTINGNEGPDTISGGLGNDQLNGGAGSDTYLWSIGDGNDTITEVAAGDLDVLVLSNVNASAVTLSRIEGQNHLIVKVGSETIQINDQFWGAEGTYSIERIRFADGHEWNLQEIQARTAVTGDANAQTLNGKDNRLDNLFGGGGNDTLYGRSGDDYLTGGTGIDWLEGGAGSDRYLWTKGDGNDTIRDNSGSTTDIDSLSLTNAAQSEVSFTKIGNDVRLAVNSTGEAILIKDVFYASTENWGVEFVEFSDGSTTRILNNAVAELVTNGTTAANNLIGWNFRDQLFGGAGNDSLHAERGDDLVVGGAGDDLTRGHEGNDVYRWSIGDGNDQLDDDRSGNLDVDRLELVDVTSGMVTLERQNGSNHSTIRIAHGATTSIITLEDQYRNENERWGIEEIKFADGEIWTLDDILARTKLNGTASAETRDGSGFADNILGQGGNDTLNGNNGSDTLDGGIGADSLRGGAGSDVYVWRIGDGADTINDDTASATTVDRLRLVDVNPANVILERQLGSTHLVVKVTSGAVTTSILVMYQFWNNNERWGIEEIEFADGTVWTLDDILDRSALTGTASGESISGSGFRDMVHGLAGNDTLSTGGGADTIQAGDGNDSIESGSGDDVIYGGLGDDWVVYNDGNDSIYGGAGNDVINDRWGWYENGHNLLDGGDGNDSLYQGAGNDTVFGGNGDDLIEDEGLSFSDDLMSGGAGNDTIIAGTGYDTLIGGAGNDILYGGDGSDEFIFAPSFGIDRIEDFSNLDFIDLKDIASIDSYSDLLANHTAQSGSNVVISDGLGSTVTLVNFNISSLTQDMFVF